MKWVRSNILSDNAPRELKWEVPVGTVAGTDLETKVFKYDIDHAFTDRHAIIVANQTTSQVLLSFKKKYVVDSASLVVDDFEDAAILADADTISEYTYHDLFSGVEGVEVGIRVSAETTADGYVLLVVREL